MVLANVITDLTDWLDEIAGHWWFLLVILAIAFLDSVIPVVPSETAVILGGVMEAALVELARQLEAGTGPAVDAARKEP